MPIPEVAASSFGGCGVCGVVPLIALWRRRRRHSETEVQFPEKCVREAPSLCQLRFDDVVIGGHFGRVCTAAASDGRRWAITVYAKKEVQNTKQDTYLASLQNLAPRWRHPHIVLAEPHWAWDERFLYNVAEFCPGGSLYSWLQCNGHFNDAQAAACVVQVVSALQYLHSFSVVYRNLKAEAILIDAGGLLKLSCSRFSKRLPTSGRLWTLCGVTEYLAPEMLLCRGHGLAVDLWALGVLSFELLTGLMPFTKAPEDRRRLIVYEKIIHCRYAWPEDGDVLFTRGAQRLIQSLLIGTPNRRPSSCDLAAKPKSNISRWMVRRHGTFEFEDVLLWLRREEAKKGVMGLPFASTIDGLAHPHMQNGEAAIQCFAIRPHDEPVANEHFPALDISSMESLAGQPLRKSHGQAQDFQLEAVISGHDGADAAAGVCATATTDEAVPNANEVNMDEADEQFVEDQNVCESSKKNGEEEAQKDAELGMLVDGDRKDADGSGAETKNDETEMPEHEEAENCKTRATDTPGTEGREDVKFASELQEAAGTDEERAVRECEGPLNKKAATSGEHEDADLLAEVDHAKEVSMPPLVEELSCSENVLGTNVQGCFLDDANTHEPHQLFESIEPDGKGCTCARPGEDEEEEPVQEFTFAGVDVDMLRPEPQVDWNEFTSVGVDVSMLRPHTLINSNESTSVVVDVDVLRSHAQIDSNEGTPRDCQRGVGEVSGAKNKWPPSDRWTLNEISEAEAVTFAKEGTQAECEDLVDKCGSFDTVTTSAAPLVGLGTKPHALDLTQNDVARESRIHAKPPAKARPTQDAQSRRNPVVNGLDSRLPSLVGSDQALPDFQDVLLTRDGGRQLTNGRQQSRECFPSLRPFPETKDAASTRRPSGNSNAPTVTLLDDAQVGTLGYFFCMPCRQSSFTIPCNPCETAPVPVQQLSSSRDNAYENRQGMVGMQEGAIPVPNVRRPSAVGSSFPRAYSSD